MASKLHVLSCASLSGSSSTPYYRRRILLALVSRTTRLTCVHDYPELLASANFVANILLEGRFPFLDLTPLLEDLPGLKRLDLVNFVMKSVRSSINPGLHHSWLVSFTLLPSPVLSDLYQMAYSFPLFATSRLVSYFVRIQLL